MANAHIGLGVLFVQFLRVPTTVPELAFTEGSRPLMAQMYPSYTRPQLGNEFAAAISQMIPSYKYTKSPNLQLRKGSEAAILQKRPSCNSAEVPKLQLHR